MEYIYRKEREKSKSICNDIKACAWGESSNHSEYKSLNEWQRMIF
jgi:hypothetical protein